MCSSSKCADWALFLLRLVLGVAFVYHGWGKLFGHMPGMEMFTGMVGKMGFPLPAVFAYIAALIEFIGGIMMLIGIHVKHAGYGLAAVMLVALLGAHRLGFGPTGFSFASIELPLAYFFMSLAVAFLGPGCMVLMRCPGKCCQGACDCGKKGCQMCKTGDKK